MFSNEYIESLVAKALQEGEEAVAFTLVDRVVDGFVKGLLGEPRHLTFVRPRPGTDGANPDDRDTVEVWGFCTPSLFWSLLDDGYALVGRGAPVLE